MVSHRFVRWFSFPPPRKTVWPLLQFFLVLPSVLLQLIVLFLPTQLGLHLWPDFSRAAGIKIDYLSPVLYLLDLPLFLYLLTSSRLVATWLKNNYRGVAVLTLFIAGNTLYSISPPNTFIWWLRTLLYLIFFLCLRLQRVSWKQIRHPLIISTFVVILIETIQLYHQSSLGGPFYWLGERAYLATTSGLGHLSLWGRDIVRPQSTFSHPNSLAGFLLIVYYLLHLHRSPLWQRLIVFIGLILTFSKAALLAFLLVVILGLSPLVLTVSFIGISLSQLLLTLPFPAPQFVSDRVFFLSPLRKMILTSPLIGVGLGGFIPALAEILPGSHLLSAKLQPAHNLILLVVAEIGVLGAFLTGWILRQNLNKRLSPQFFGFLALIVITGTFDHYWWTLSQNKLILLLTAALLL